MKERNLHKIIEEQNTEEKKVVWQDIEPNICQKKSSNSLSISIRALFLLILQYVQFKLQTAEGNKVKTVCFKFLFILFFYPCVVL